MRNTLKFIALAMLALAAPAARGATITYDAVIGCDNTCITVFAEWQNISPGVSFLEVDDNFGDFLFGLNTAPFPESTGSIIPDPQTISGLDPDTIALIQSGGSDLGGQLQSNSIGLFQSQENPSFANLVFKDSDGDVIVEVRFTGSEEVPEPAVWSMTGAGLGLLFLFRRARLRDALAPK